MRSYTVKELEDLADKFLGIGAEPNSMGNMDDNQVISDFLEYLKSNESSEK